MYISRLKIYISRLEIYISRLEMKNSRRIENFSRGIGNFFRPLSLLFPLGRTRITLKRMKRNVQLLWVALAALVQVSQVSAQEAVHTDTLSLKVYFQRGYSTFDPSFRDNARKLEAFAGQLRQVAGDSLQRVHPVRIVGAASPEGMTVMNKRLARKRAESLIGWMSRQAALSGLRYEVQSVGVDWKGLEKLVEESDMPHRDAALEILRNTPEWIRRDGRIVDGRKRQLGMLQGGRVWHYMAEHFFPELRSSALEIQCVVTRPIPVEPVPQPVRQDTVLPHDTIAGRETLMTYNAAKNDCPDRQKRSAYWALKTNMLYDALLVPNLGIEFSLGKGWTLGGSYLHAWWSNNHRHRYWRIQGGELNVRKYFGHQAAIKPLQGHHLGVYGQLLTYDIERGGRGYLGDRWSWGAGLEYGYSLPVARRLNIDFSIGLGYLGGEYQEYLPKDGHYVWQATKQRRWFGPTKAEVSLVWLLGRNNNNRAKGKGGQR